MQYMPDFTLPSHDFDMDWIATFQYISMLFINTYEAILLFMSLNEAIISVEYMEL